MRVCYSPMNRIFTQEQIVTCYINVNNVRDDLTGEPQTLEVMVFAMVAITQEPTTQQLSCFIIAQLSVIYVINCTFK